VHGNGIEWMSYLGPNSPELLPESFKGQNESTCNLTCQNLLNSLIQVTFEEGTDIFDYKLPVDYFPNMRYVFSDSGVSEDSKSNSSTNLANLAYLKSALSMLPLIFHSPLYTIYSVTFCFLFSAWLWT
jgi:hypothetical protein